MRRYQWMILLPLLVAPASAALAVDLPPNTINCADFKKLPNGNWHAGHATFDIGSLKDFTLENTDVEPGGMSLGGVSLFDALNQKCGGSRT